MSSAHLVAFVTVVYPGMESYLPDFLESLDCQYNQDFELVLINDGLEHLETHFKKFERPFRILDAEGNLSTLRQRAFLQIRDLGFDFLIFGDSDDVYSPLRVERCVQALVDHEAFVHDFDMVDSKLNPILRSYLSQRLKKGFMLDSKFLNQKNICGFSNTAIRSDLLVDLNFSPRWRVVDWPMFFQILQKTTDFLYEPISLTKYRQHDSNLARLKKQDLESLLYTLEVRKLHFQTLIDMGFSLHFEQDANQKNLDSLKKLSNLKDSVLNTPFWWEVDSTLFS